MERQSRIRKEKPAVQEISSWVGLDVHKRDMLVTRIGPGQEAETWKLANEPRAVRRLARKLVRESPGEVLCAYEAGPCGYVLQRQLAGAGVSCQVVAPSLIPSKPGDRIKTDRRDSRKLAELLRADLLTEVQPPSEEQEAVRDLCRCREDTRRDLHRSRQRLSKFLLRRGVQYGQGRAWTERHRQWLYGLRLEPSAAQWTLESCLVGIEQLEVRVQELDRQLAQIAQAPPYREAVGRLRCFRGIDTLSAMIIMTELHEIRRFRSARALMAYLGLVPSEHSSGERRRRGAITKTGNRRLRRILIEAAWHSRHRPAVGKALRQRRQGQPAQAIALADRAMHRLHRRYWRMLSMGKPQAKAVTAVARELAGFVWATLHSMPETTS